MIERFDVTRTTPYGTDLDPALPVAFERVDAVATVALDPDLPGNRVVVDLQRARRDPDGLVRADTDVVLIRPAAHSGKPSEADVLLVAVANRGLVTALPLSADVPPFTVPDGSVAPGDAWALRRGMAVAWVGWQWDVQRRPGVVGIDVPEARGSDGLPLLSQARLELMPLVAVPHRRLADEPGPQIGHFRALAAADVDESGASLTVRDWFNGPRQMIERRRWRFARDVDNGSPVEDDEHVWLDGGFEARRLYELTYTTRVCPVAGFSLAAVRDAVSLLRAELGVGRVLAFGASQSGRWLRQFVEDTANTAGDGGPVFDGVLCHIAGGRKGEFNNRSAQPSTMNALGFTHRPPFSPEGGLFDAARARGNSPLTIFANTATEYWRGDASLVHTDEAGADVADGPDWRTYLYAGAHHAAGIPEAHTAMLPVQFGPNRVEVLWASRAHLVALDEWVANGRPPPTSEVPRVADGTGVRRPAVLERLAADPRLARFELPGAEALLEMAPIDLGPDAAVGVGRYPAVVAGPPRPCLVAALDADGNERCGVRMPEVAVPLAVSFGWNPEIPRPSAPGRHHPIEVWNLLGGAIDFDVAEILDRYGDRDRYLALVVACAEDLVARRHLLSEDAARVAAHAAQLWDRVVGSEAAATAPG